MAKQFTPKKKPSKSDLASSFDSLSIRAGAGLQAVLPQRLEEDREGTIQALSRQFAMLPLKDIFPNPDQPRKEFEKEALEALAESIKFHGIIQPMTVRHMGDGTYQIIGGERRYRASKMAGLEEVPAFIRTADDQTLLEMALIENIQRQDLNPMEIAYSYYRLKEDFNLTQHDVADRVGKPRTTVANYLGILTTSPKVQDAIREKKISIGVAKTFVAIKDVGQQELLLKEILANEGWTVRDVEEVAKAYQKKNKPGKPRSPRADELDDFLERCKAFFGTSKVRITLDGKLAKSGTLSISFANQEELEEWYKAMEPQLE